MIFEKSNIPKTEKREVVLTMIVRGGASTAIAQPLTGAQIERLEKYYT